MEDWKKGKETIVERLREKDPMKFPMARYEAADEIERLNEKVDVTIASELAQKLQDAQTIVEQEEQINELRAVLSYVADNTYCGKDANWHFKPEYDPQKVLDAILD